MPTNNAQPSRTRRAPPRGSTGIADGGPRRVTTSLVMMSRQIALIKRIADLRALQGRTNPGVDGIKRRYSMSAVVVEILDRVVPDLEKELLASGIALPPED